VLRIGLRIADASASTYLKLKFNVLYLLIVGATFSKWFFLASAFVTATLISKQKILEALNPEESNE